MDDLTRALLAVSDQPQILSDLNRLLQPLCHRYRNRLNCLKLGMYLARRSMPEKSQTALQRLDATYHEIEQFVDRLQEILGDIRLVTISAPLGLVFSEHHERWAACLTQRGISLKILPPREDHPVVYDPAQLGQALDSVFTWRSRRAPSGSRIQVSWHHQAATLLLKWRETADPEAAPAATCPPLPVSSPGDLALARFCRIVSLHGGTLRCGIEPAFRMDVSLPAHAVVHPNPTADRAFDIWSSETVSTISHR